MIITQLRVDHRYLFVVPSRYEPNSPRCTYQKYARQSNRWLGMKVEYPETRRCSACISLEVGTEEEVVPSAINKQENTSCSRQPNYLNGITIAIYRSAAMMQRFEMEITANCHDTIPRRTLSHERDFSQKYVPGKKRRTKEKSAAASDGTNQFVDVWKCFVMTMR